MKVAIITGGSSGIGFSVRKAMLAHGYRVVYTYKTSEQTDLHKNEISLPLDVCDPVSVERFCESVVNLGIEIDFLLLNAGYTEFIDAEHTLQRLDPFTFEKVLNANVTSNYAIVYHLSKVFRESCHVVMTSSIAAFTGIGSNLAYTLAKAALVKMTAILPKVSPSTRFNAVAPGLMRTDFTSEFPETYFESYIDRTPTKRLSTPEDVAKLIVELEISSHQINGQTIIIDGGAY
ncbi:SDR family oxidoreductase [Litorivicinus sp.]|nr:SDR family oxidoreductase [Litorivicinus sp.]